MAGAIWIDRLEKLEIDGESVRVVLGSEDSFVHLRMSRAQLRSFAERARIQLAEMETIERKRVGPALFGKGGK